MPMKLINDNSANILSPISHFHFTVTVNSDWTGADELARRIGLQKNAAAVISTLFV